MAKIIGEEFLAVRAAGRGRGARPEPASGISSASEFDREKLGRRAFLRRNELRLSRREVVDGLVINKWTLAIWEQSLPKSIYPDTEAGWERALRVPPGWLRDASVPTPLAQADDAVLEVTQAMAPGQTVAEIIRVVGCWLSRDRSADRTVRFDALNVLERRRAEMFAQRFGVLGEPESTLQAIGDRYGLSRERIRKITEKSLGNCQGFSIVSATLDRLEDSVATLCPATVDHVSKEMRELLGEQLSIVSAVRFLTEVAGRDHLCIADNPADPSITPSKIVLCKGLIQQDDLVRTLREEALKMIRWCGAAQVHYLVGAASETLGRPVDFAAAVRHCRLSEGFEWLVQDSGWFWFGEDFPSDNRILTVVRRMLSVARKRLHVEQILQGIARSRRVRFEGERTAGVMLEPTFTVINAVLGQLRWAQQVQHTFVTAREPLDPSEWLSPTEFRLYKFFEAAGGVVQRSELIHQLVAKEGMPLVTLQVALSAAPFLFRVEEGVFGLHGWRDEIADEAV